MVTWLVIRAKGGSEIRQHLHRGILQQWDGVESRRVVLHQAEPSRQVISDRVRTHQVAHLPLQGLFSLTHWGQTNQSLELNFDATLQQNHMSTADTISSVSLKLSRHWHTHSRPNSYTHSHSNKRTQTPPLLSFSLFLLPTYPP